MTIAALIAAAFTVSSALRARGEEVAARAEWQLASPLSRVHWLLGWLVVTALGTVLVLTATGLGAGVAYALVSRDAGQVPLLVGAALAYVPAALVLGGVAVAAYGWLPRWVGLAWGALAGCFVIGWLGEILSLPTWLMDLSPFTQTPQVPVEDLTVGPMAALLGLAVLLVALGTVGLRRRDLVTG